MIGWIEISSLILLLDTIWIKNTCNLIISCISFVSSAGWMAEISLTLYGRVILELYKVRTKGAVISQIFDRKIIQKRTNRCGHDHMIIIFNGKQIGRQSFIFKIYHLNKRIIVIDLRKSSPAFFKRHIFSQDCVLNKNFASRVFNSLLVFQRSISLRNGSIFEKRI